MRHRMLLLATAAFTLGAEDCGEQGEPPAQPEDDQQCYVLYLDLDGDGYGTGAPQEACGDDLQDLLDQGFASQDGDCDDADVATNPGADEDPCSTDDLDCDGEVAAEEGLFYDNDEDGFHAGEACTCEDLAAGAECVDEEDGGDCDDIDADAYPGAAPEDSETACMRDVDGDGWGDTAASGAVEPGTDCDDLSSVACPGCPTDLDGDGRSDECDGEEDLDCSGDLDECGPAVYDDCHAMAAAGESTGTLRVSADQTIDATCTTEGELVVTLAFLEELVDLTGDFTLLITRYYPGGTSPALAEVPAALSSTRLSMSSHRNFSYNGYSACSEVQIGLPWEFVAVEGGFDGAAAGGGTGPDDDGAGTWGASYNSYGMGHVLFGVREADGSRHALKEAGTWGRDFEASSWSSGAGAVGHAASRLLLFEYCDDGLSGEQLAITNLQLELQHPEG